MSGGGRTSHIVRDFIVAGSAWEWGVGFGHGLAQMDTDLAEFGGGRMRGSPGYAE